MFFLLHCLICYFHVRFFFFISTGCLTSVLLNSPCVCIWNRFLTCVMTIAFTCHFHTSFGSIHITSLTKVEGNHNCPLVYAFRVLSLPCVCPMLMRFFCFCITFAQHFRKEHAACTPWCTIISSGSLSGKEKQKPNTMDSTLYTLVSSSLFCKNPGFSFPLVFRWLILNVF